MKIFALVLSVLALNLSFFQPAFAADEMDKAAKEDYVDIGGGQRLWASYKAPKNGAPTVVLLHGLTYTMKPWNYFADDLVKLNPDVGVLRYDMTGMGKTLLGGPLPVNYEITYQNQVRQLRALLEIYKIEKPTLVGLSYGGAIALAYAATYPGTFDKLILMAPFTEPLESQDKFIRTQISATRIAFPFNPSTDAQLYDFFLRQFVYTTFPLSEPVTVANPYILEAVYQMTRSVRFFHASAIVDQLPPNSVHLMVGGQDQYIPREVLDRFWNSLPEATRASRTNIAYTEHKIPEAAPTYSASWVNEIIKGNKLLSGGRVFEGNPWTFKARSGETEIAVPRP
ncbi:MAG: alpha/beta hydrolase [Proteobacteria bacterium]|nr:MAG: alpha/beta hydrolase [Pseudomonadota bacterium]